MTRLASSIVLALVALTGCKGALGDPASAEEQPRYADHGAAPASAPPGMVPAGSYEPDAPRAHTAVAGDGEEDTAYVAPANGVKAGEWDDNANYRDFVRYLDSSTGHVDVRGRRFIVVRDANGKAVPNCAVEIRDAQQNSVTLTTTASGRALLFPSAEGLAGQLTAATTCAGSTASAKLPTQGGDAAVDLQLTTARVLPQQRTIDVAFILDTTGSMSEEIEGVKSTIRSVAGTLAKLNVKARVGLVEYRDQTDQFVTRTYPMSSNIDDFARTVASLAADGGGDTPEHMNAGLRVAIHELGWSQQSVARLAFLVGDAPPHLDYANDTQYTATMQKANHAGIQVFTIAASGMDAVGQSVWRQIAQYTGGTNMFVLRGGAGPMSTGAGDAVSGCGETHKNYSSGNLSELVSDKIKITVKSLDLDPLAIAGLGQDELAKPCGERLIIAAE
jgi:hypothetical protein